MNNSNQTSGNSNGPRTGVGERVGHIGDSAQQLFSEASAAVTDISELLDLRGRTQRNPYLMVAAAVGVGYLLGGGLFTPLTARLVRVGVRLAAIPFVKDELISIAGQALDGVVAGAATRSSGGES
jgi:hypothetical protein